MDNSKSLISKYIFKTPVQKVSRIKRSIYYFDATGKSVGRLASEVVYYLSGKSNVDFTPNYDSGHIAYVYNLRYIKNEKTSLEHRDYFKHHRLPGSWTRISHREIFEKSPSRLFLLAIQKMLAKNKLRKGHLSRLKVYDLNYR